MNNDFCGLVTWAGTQIHRIQLHEFDLTPLFVITVTKRHGFMIPGYSLEENDWTTEYFDT